MIRTPLHRYVSGLLGLVLTCAVIGCASGSGPAPKAAPPPIEITYTPITPIEEEPGPPALVEVPLEPLQPLGEPEAPVDEALAETVPAADPAALLAVSLATFEQAQELWQQGDIDAALAALDQAYAAMADARADEDPELLRQQEDLRRLIARRVVEVYASRRTVVGDADAAIPMVLNDHVRREIASFQGSERKEFLAGFERSGLFRPRILAELRAAGLPEQLSWLPMVESWYKVRALSTARALGMWQFIPSTGYRFGLSRSDWVDERMDPEKSTTAALAYLTELHDMFGDWLTAIAAYNCGETRVLRTINRQHLSYFDQFWDLYEQLPRETRRYVPRFLAVLEILRDPSAYGFDDLPVPLDPLPESKVEIARSVRLAELEKNLGLVAGELAALNPELRSGVTPNGVYRLRVPDRTDEKLVIAAVGELPVATRPTPTPSATGTHVVRSGETLSTIASRYRVATSTLMRLNGLSDPNRLRVGQRLRVAGTASSVRGGGGGGGGSAATYTVRPGDSLWLIASRYGTTVDRLRRDNGLNGNALQPGQRLKVSAEAGRVHVVRSGDTLGRIASALRISLRQLAEANGLTLASTIYPGQRLLIPGS
ncbi:MAG TPA: LysM peptidoglycan-binding domain-containing protein [Thermoanaerobaculia bacterium]|nr:LysM peptidoglycan-binding domain-containing protein [Thermoanaerobaculia bacterium]